MNFGYPVKTEKPAEHQQVIIFSGGDEGARTPDLSIAKAMVII